MDVAVTGFYMRAATPEQGRPEFSCSVGAEDKSTRLLSHGPDTHVPRPAARSAGGAGWPPPLPNSCPALRPILCCAAQVTTAHMKCIPGGPTTAWLRTKMAPIKSFPFRSAVAHVEGRMIWVLSCGQRIPELSLEPKHALVALQMPPGVC